MKKLSLADARKMPQKPADDTYNELEEAKYFKSVDAEVEKVKNSLLEQNLSLQELAQMSAENLVVGKELKLSSENSILLLENSIKLKEEVWKLRNQNDFYELRNSLKRAHRLGQIFGVSKNAKLANDSRNSVRRGAKTWAEEEWQKLKIQSPNEKKKLLPKGTNPLLKISLILT